MPHPNVAVERGTAGYPRRLLARRERPNALDPAMVSAPTDVMNAAVARGRG
jgi:hypothetical protein